MNLTTGNTTFNTWKRIKLQYVAAACGLALAAGAAVALPGLRTAENPAPVARPSLSSSAITPAWARAQHVVYYLVGSQEQADLIRAGEQQAARERLSAGMPSFHYESMVLVAPTPEQVLGLRAALASAAQESQSSATYEVIDLR